VSTLELVPTDHLAEKMLIRRALFAGLLRAQLRERAD
jgi:hypothetical protein